MDTREKKAFNAVHILQTLSNPVRNAIISSLNSKGKAFKFSELMQASGLDPNFDSGHFGYHLSELIKRGIICKINDKYQLTRSGLKVSRILDTVQREGSSLTKEHNSMSETKMEKGEDFWEKHWFPSVARGWSRAESTADSLCKIFSENGIRAGKVLDLCCGTGRLSIWLSKKGFNTVGLDSSSLYLKEASKRAIEHDVKSKVKFILGDVRQVDEISGLKGPFDCVINFWNSIGVWGEKIDEMIFAKVRKMIKKDGVLVIGECDHLGQLMLNFDKKRVLEYENATIIEEANMDYITNMFTAVFHYYTKEGDLLKYFDSMNFQTRIYSVCELSSLLERAGLKVTKAYENIESLVPFTGSAIFKGNRSMNVVAKAV